MPQKLVDRLTSQIAAEGKPVAAARKIAVDQLERRGHLKNGELTAEGKKREALGAAGRAKERAAKYYGGKPSDYVFNSRTNNARKR